MSGGAVSVVSNGVANEGSMVDSEGAAGRRSVIGVGGVKVSLVPFVVVVDDVDEIYVSDAMMAVSVTGVGVDMVPPAIG